MSLSVSEMYNKLYCELKEIRDAYDSAKARISRKTDEDLVVRERRITNLEEQLKRIDEYRAQVEYFRLQAEKHLESKNLLTIIPRELNFSRLRYWYSMMSYDDTDDPYAQRIYVQCMCNLMFLDKKEAEFKETLANLHNSTDSVDEELLRETEGVINTLIERETAIFSTSLSDEFQQALLQRKAEAIDVDRMESMTGEETREMFSIGSYAVPFPVLDELAVTVKAKYGSFFKEEGLILLPASFYSNKDFVLRIEASPSREKVLYRGIQNLLLNQMISGGSATRSVVVLDAIHFNNHILGVLRPLEGSVIEQIPQDSDELMDSLKQIIYSFTELDEKIGFADSVEQFNLMASPEEYIPRRTVVVVGYPHAFTGEGKDLMQRLIYNHDHYGISLILVDTRYSPKRERNLYGEDSLEEENVYRVRMSKKDDSFSVSEEKRYTFSWYELKQSLSPSLIERLAALKLSESKLGTEYDKRIQLNLTPKYVRNYKDIELPYGVDSNDIVHSISFSNENFAHYLMGASGSGKSTLLHTLITGIINNYHPDDVELWLADFKMAEFSQYINPCPPHIKYILLDESPELVYDLVDKLTEKMMERQHFFMQSENREYKKVENIPPKKRKYMPIIFVILDEFSIMSQTLAESEQYKLKLQNILAKGRALGIKLIFSSQTFIKGISGLTSTAKDQIQTRIAMKNSYDEINQTLELSSNTRTDQVKSWMEALPPHYVMVKYRDKDGFRVDRLEVLYFAGKGKEAMKAQRDLINGVINSMQSVSEDEYAKSDNTYVDKHPVIVDGNSFEKFAENKINVLRERWQKEAKLDDWDDILISPGTPRRMSSAEFIRISKESRQNIMLLASNNEQPCAMSIIEAVMKQVRSQGGMIHVWAYERNRLYHKYKSVFFEDMDVVVGVESIAIAIHDLKKSIDERRESNDFYVLLGMEQICADFELLDIDEIRIVSANGDHSFDSESLMANTEQELQELQSMNEKYADLDDAIENMMDSWIEAGRSQEEIEKEMERMISEDAKRRQAISTDGSTTENDAAQELSATNNSALEADKNANETIKPRKKLNPYNEFLDILSKGSRWGNHFLLLLNNYSDIKSTGAKLDWFTHRLSFLLSNDDSTAYFGNRSGSRLPEHVCQYSNMLDHFSFRPYLHKGIGWEGWEIDDSDNVVDADSLLN